MTNHTHGFENLGPIVVALATESLGAGGLVFLDLDGMRSLQNGIGIVVQQPKQLDERISKKNGLDVRQFVGMAMVLESAIGIVLLKTRRRVVPGLDCGTIHVCPSAFAIVISKSSSSSSTIAGMIIVSPFGVAIVSIIAVIIVDIAVAVVVSVFQVSPTAALAGIGASIVIRGVASIVAASPTTSQMRRYVSSWHCSR